MLEKTEENTAALLDSLLLYACKRAKVCMCEFDVCLRRERLLVYVKSSMSVHNHLAPTTSLNDPPPFLSFLVGKHTHKETHICKHNTSIECVDM